MNTLLDMHGMHHGGPMAGGHGFGLFAFLPGLFLLIVLGVIAFLLFRNGRVGPVRWDPNGAPRAPWAAAQPHPEDEAMATLRMRLAQGDITPEEYLERSSVLRPTPPTTPPTA